MALYLIIPLQKSSHHLLLGHINTICEYSRPRPTLYGHRKLDGFRHGLLIPYKPTLERIHGQLNNCLDKSPVVLMEINSGVFTTPP